VTFRQGCKFTVIGGGSSYTPELVEGIIKRRQALPLRELALVDVPEGREKVEAVAALARRMLKRAGLRTSSVTVTFDRREALEGADFVINQFRVGGLKARASDERIPLKYDVVGQETTGPGGFAKALRTVPVVLEVARDVSELAPNAWIMNFTNPAGIVTEAILTHGGGVKCIGLCNVPVSIQRAICGQLDVEPWRVELDLVGLNHLGWIKAVRLDGLDILPKILSLPVVEEKFVENIPGVTGMRPLLDALGMLPSPYLTYYYFHDQLLAKEREEIASGRGTRAEQVMAVEKDLFNRYQDPDLAEKPPELEKRGGAYYSEAALDVMVSLVGAGEGPADGPRNRHIVNVLNRVPQGGIPAGVEAGGEIRAGGETPAGGAAPAGGEISAGGAPPAAAGTPGTADAGAARAASAASPAVPDLPTDAVIETPCLVGPSGVRPVGGAPLPLSVRGLVQQVKAYEQLTVEAAVTGDRRAAFLALLNHPLVPGAEAARGLLDDILEANRAYLPAFQR